MAAIVVHGRAQDPGFMLDALVNRLGLPDVGYILPAAKGGSWYPARFAEPVAANEPWLGHALEACEAAVESAEAAGVPIERTALVGFSQGGCLVADYLARRPRPFGAVAILTGSLIGPAEEATEPTARLEGVPVLCGSSRHDEWVPIERVEATAQTLGGAGAEVELEVYEDRAHVICDSAVAGVRRLLAGIGSEPANP